MSRLCIKCNTVKPTVSFSENRKVCKSCRNLQRKLRYAANLNNCRYVILELNKNYRANNRDACRENKRNYERAHKPEARVRARKFRELNAELIVNKKRDYHYANADVICKKVKDWRMNNLPKKRATNAKRRALLKGAKGCWYTTFDHIISRWIMWGNNCWICGSNAEATDHVIPLGDGGSHWPSNLRPICRSCNSRRRKRRSAIVPSNISSVTNMRMSLCKS